MRVRPFFWFILILSCVGVLLFAVMLPTDVPATMQIRLAEHPTTQDLTTLTFHLTDPQGLPIDQAYVVSSAAMTNMNMVAPQSHVTAVGRGTYLARFRLYMAGPWAITITVHATGFTLVQQKRVAAFAGRQPPHRRRQRPWRRGMSTGRRRCELTRHDSL